MANFAESTYLRGRSGNVATVVNNGLSISPKSEFMQAVEDGMAFSWASLTANIDTGDTIIGVQNASTAHILVIEKIIISGTVAGGSVCPVFCASGVTMAGTAVPGVNLNRKSNIVATDLAIAKSDETGNTEAASSWPYRLYMPQCLTSVPYIIQVGGAVRLPYNHAIFIDAIEEVTAENATILGWFKAI